LFNFKIIIINIGFDTFFSNRYSIGETDLPFFTQWVQQVLNIDLTLRNVPREKFGPQELPPPNIPIS
jgi:hypothetical protein